MGILLISFPPLFLSGFIFLIMQVSTLKLWEYILEEKDQQFGFSHVTILDASWTHTPQKKYELKVELPELECREERAQYGWYLFM